MKRMNIIMISIFLCGILLTGIGTGIAFGEYSSLEFGGEKIMGKEKEEEIVLEQEIPIGKKAKKTILHCYSDTKYTLEEKKSVPEGVVRCIVKGNPDYVVPSLDYIPYDSLNGYEEEGENYSGELHLNSNTTKGEFELFMECKDQILSDLKNHKISSYSYEPWESITIQINPKTMKYVKEVR